MTNKITEPGVGEVFLGGTYFPLVKEGNRAGSVQDLDITAAPQRRLQGDITRATNPNLSSIAFSDFRGGIGLDVMEGFETNRCWTSTCNIRYLRSLVLPPLVTETAAVLGSANAVNTMNELGSEVYAMLSSVVRKYDNSGDSWGATLDTATGVNSFNITLGGTEYLLFTHVSGAGYTYTSDGSSFTDATQDVTAFAEWDNRLWGLDVNTGDIWYAFTPGTETIAGRLPLQGSVLVAFYVYRSARSGGTAIYALTQKGLYEYDAANEDFILTSLFGYSSTNVGSELDRVATFRDTIYVGMGQSVYQHRVEGSIQSIGLVGPGADDGFDTTVTGQITSLVASLNEVFITLSGFVFAWDNNGWYQIAGGLTGTVDLFVSSAYGEYRLYGDDRSSSEPRVWYIDLPTAIINPKKDTTVTYAASGELKTPWFHADQVDVDKLARRLKVETEDCNSNETVTISYATDYDDNIYSQFDAITTNGIKSLTFPLFGDHLNFDGTNDQVNCGSDSSIDNIWDGGGYLRARFRLDDLGAVSGLLNKSAWGVDIGTNGEITFAHTFSGDNASFVTTDARLVAGIWYTLEQGYDSDAVGNVPVMKLDGRILTISTTAPTGTRDTDAAGNVNIGGGLVGFFDGDITELALYDADSITDDITKELVGTETSLVAYWKFNENTGTTANDSSTNSNTGTVDGATWVEGADPKGRTFRAIRFKVALARGGTTTNSPRLVALTLEYRKKFERKEGYTFLVDMTKGRWKGNTPAKLRSALQRLVGLNTLSEFTFRDDSGGTRNFYVDVRIPSASERTGHIEEGQTLVEVKEL